MAVLDFFCWREVFILAGPRFLKVEFFNVGQGDSAFIETPQGHQILIDGGPDPTVLSKLNSLMPFWDKEIDVVILTHPEKDHMAGILDVLQRYKVDYFLWTGVVKNDAENKKLSELLDKISQPRNNFFAALVGFLSRDKKPTITKIINVSAGTKIKAGNAKMDILYPSENLAGKEMKDTSNDTCVVSKLIYGKDSFLFTGDISSSAEKNLAKIVGGRSAHNLRADVLKVAHHGSKYSTSELFLQNVQPEYAVISVGKNSYGHPTPEVLQRLDKYGIKTLITDQSGDIEFVSDGQNIKIIN